MASIFDEAATNAEQLAWELEQEFRRDRLYTKREQALVAQARTVYGLVEKAGRCVYVGVRLINGGRVDRGLIGQVKEAEALIHSTQREAPAWTDAEAG